MWNIHILKTHSTLASLDDIHNWAVTYYQAMEKSPNHFALMEKIIYHNYFVTNFKDLAITHGKFPWRLSNKITANVMNGIIVRKYQPWAEQFNLHIIRLQVSFYSPQ